MGTTTLIGAAVVAALLLTALVMVAVALGRARRRREHLLAMVSSAEETARGLAERVEQLESSLRRLRSQDREGAADFVITDAGAVRLVEEPVAPEQPPVRLSDQVILSATFGEPLVRAAALGHGLRRALSAQSRNRIWFAMRQEVRRSRKQRRRDMRAAYRRMQLGETP